MRVVVVQTAYLGDTVLTTPLLRELRRVVPDLELTVVAAPAGAEILRGLDSIDEIVVFAKRSAGLGGLARLALELRERRFDAAIAAQRSHRTAILLRASGAARRIGFAGAPGAWAYTERVARDPAAHATRRYLALAAPLGGAAPDGDGRTELVLSAAEREEAERLLVAAGLDRRAEILCLVPGSVWATKRWLPEGFAAVARAGRALGLRPVLLGAPDERELCRHVAALCGGAAVLAGQTSVRGLAALLARARVLVSNDSGSMHVAAAVGTPVVAVFGPTTPALGFAPLGVEHRIVERAGLPCRPCSPHGGRRCPLGHFRCMRELPAADVVRALESVLAQRRPG